jgi:2-hydroxy-3-oxopropionate reductase
MKIGFCGTGLMGTQIALRLLQAGHTLYVWNRSQAKLASLTSAGASSVGSPAAAAAASEIVCLCLLDARAVEEVVFGIDGIASATGPRLLIDHSSISPARTRIFSEKLRASSGMTWIDAPVSGGTAGAQAGNLTIMAGGSAEAVKQAREVMGAYATRITHMGAVGAGQATKLCNQTIVAATILSIAEAIALARNSGLDPALLTEALDGGWADSKLLRIFVPRMVEPPATLLGALKTMLKDVDAVADLAQLSGTAMPVGAAVQQVFRLAESLGLGAEDLSSVGRLYYRKTANPTGSGQNSMKIASLTL